MDIAGVKRKKGASPMVEGNTTLTNQTESPVQPPDEAGNALKTLMGMQPEAPMPDKQSVKSFLKSAGVDTGGINLDNPAEVLTAYQRTKGNSPKDPREAPKEPQKV